MNSKMYILFLPSSNPQTLTVDLGPKIEVVTENSNSHLVSLHPVSDYRCRLDRLEIISTIRWNLEHFPILFFVSRGSEINTYLNNTLYIFFHTLLLLLYNIVTIIFSVPCEGKNISWLSMSFWFFKNINQIVALLCLKFFIDFPLHWMKKQILSLSPRTCMMHHPLFVEWIYELGRDVMINMPHIVTLAEEWREIQLKRWGKFRL